MPKLKVELWPLAAGIGGYALSRGMAKGRVV